MRQIYYSVQAIMRGRGSNLIKVVSLALGFTVSIILFTRIAFEFSYDRFYAESDNLYQLKAAYVFDGKAEERSIYVGGKFADAISESFPDEIVSTTIVRLWRDHTLYNGNVRFTPFMLIADNHFFRTMGLEVLKGNPEDLINPERLFLSESLARRAFGEENPIGKVLTYERNIPMIVSGVYKDVPSNNSIGVYEAIVSFATLLKHEWAYVAWDGGGGFLTYIRLKDKSMVTFVNSRIDQSIAQYLPPALGFSYTAELVPIQQVHTERSDVQRMLWIMGVLALAILLAATLNYILISISSLAYRTKAIGIHKCNGASEGNIFQMFFLETFFLIALALSIMILLMINLREWIEDAIDISLGELFNLQHAWVPLLVIGFLFVLGSWLPGRIFSSISVTRLFRGREDGKKNWKYVLLFLQFIGVSFILGVLCVVLVQYNYIVDKDMGYSPKQIAYVKHKFSNPDYVQNVLSNLPYVDGVAAAGSSLVGGYGGRSGVSTSDGSSGFSPRYTTFTKNYLTLMNMKLKEGSTPKAVGEILVNETFVRMMHWTESPVGEVVNGYGTVCGVVNDFFTYDFYREMQPVAIGYQDEYDKCVHVKLKEPFTENLSKLNETMHTSFPQEDVLFLSLEHELRMQYRSVQQFRNITFSASVAVLFIVLMGLIGYTSDEVRRRSKEIALRKINGAESLDILLLLSKEIMYIALPAVVLGTIAAWYVSCIWIMAFAEHVGGVQIMTISAGLLVIVVIVACVLIKSWRIANENPVVAIKSE